MASMTDLGDPERLERCLLELVQLLLKTLKSLLRILLDLPFLTYVRLLQSLQHFVCFIQKIFHRFPIGNFPTLVTIIHLFGCRSGRFGIFFRALCSSF